MKRESARPHFPGGEARRKHGSENKCPNVFSGVSDIMVKSAIEKHLSLTLAIVVVIAASMVYWVVINVRQAVRTSDWVRHTHATILELEGTFSALNAGEALHRSYILNKDPATQEAYRRAFAEMAEHLDVAKALTVENATQFSRIENLEKTIAARLELARNLSKASEEGGLDAAAKSLKESSGVPSLGQVQKQITEITQHENKLLQQRDQAFKRNARVTKWTSLALAGLQAVLLGFVFWLVKGDVELRQQAARALQNANDQLEAKVKERTAELSKTNEVLELENLERRWANATMEQLFKRNDLIINSIGQPLFVISKRGNILGVNPAATKATGLSSTALVGKRFQEVVQRRQARGEMEDPVFQAMAQERPASETTTVTMNHQTVPMHLDCFPMRAEDKVVGAVVTLRGLAES